MGKKGGKNEKDILFFPEKEECRQTELAGKWQKCQPELGLQSMRWNVSLRVV